MSFDFFPAGAIEGNKKAIKTRIFKLGRLTLNVTTIKINVWLIYVFTERHFAWNHEGVEADGALWASSIDFINQFF